MYPKLDKGFCAPKKFIEDTIGQNKFGQQVLYIFRNKETQKGHNQK